ncbi:MAG: protein kinase [Thermoguttaceae bacterium]
MAEDNAIDSFLERLQQSELVSSDRLPSLVAEFREGAARPENAEMLAEELIKRGVLTTWQADMLLQGKHRGFRLGPYRILKPLGQGGMSKVFLAEHEMMHRRCAIKVLPSKYQEDKDLLNRFHLEAQAIAALDHPNIVRAYDFNKDVRYGKEIHYLVMEYVEGPDLRRLVEEQGPLDCRKAADFICQAAEGLAHAHAAGFVHRDIKPANLLVDPHGVLKVLDLGLATFTLDAEAALNASNGGEQTAVGTADYVAPEQVMDSRNVDGRADIYSLGHTFYFLLTGRRPFSKPTIMELLMAHRNEKPEPISTFRPDVPMELESIIDKMTAKSPTMRYQSAKDVAQRLRTWLKESGSGRGYSRIAALMAEAKRSKQTSADADGSKPEAVEENLELASLDEKSAAPAADAKSTGKETAATTPAPLPVAKKLPVAAPVPKSAEVLADLMDEDLAASALSTEPIAEVSSSLGLASRPSRQSWWAALQKSPWLWIVAGAAAIAVMAGLVWIVTAPSARTPSPIAPSSPTKPSEPVAPAPSSPVVIAPKPIPPAPKSPSAAKGQKTSAATSTDEENEMDELSPLPDIGKTPVVQAPKASSPKKVKPAPIAKTALAKTAAAEELLGGMKTIYFQLQFADQPISNPVAMAVRFEAERCAKQLNLAFSEKSDNLMTLSVKSTTAKSGVGLELTASLNHKPANGKAVTIWKGRRVIFSGDSKKTRMNPATVKIVKENVGKLFMQFENDVRRARQKPGKS